MIRDTIGTDITQDTDVKEPVRLYMQVRYENKSWGYALLWVRHFPTIFSASVASNQC
jgi:hypothetical protein